MCTFLSKEELALVRNEIFARHGYVFQTDPYKSYFNGKS
ncbi:YARHG domain-containing protein [Clostridium sp. DJ247]|nr:YARHG domain-containing protein [Clostridium sp. DJ247]